MILRFLGSIDRSDWVGRRDHLILHLMAYYGLRPGEVGLLTLDAIDWLRGTMTINQQKTSSTLILPIDERRASCGHLSTMNATAAGCPMEQRPG
jgi:integrase/recombinase XerD